MAKSTKNALRAPMDYLKAEAWHEAVAIGVDQAMRAVDMLFAQQQDGKVDSVVAGYALLSAVGRPEYDAFLDTWHANNPQTFVAAMAGLAIVGTFRISGAPDQHDLQEALALACRRLTDKQKSIVANNWSKLTGEGIPCPPLLGQKVLEQAVAKRPKAGRAPSASKRM